MWLALVFPRARLSYPAVPSAARAVPRRAAAVAHLRATLSPDAERLPGRRFAFRHRVSAGRTRGKGARARARWMYRRSRRRPYPARWTIEYRRTRSPSVLTSTLRREPHAVPHGGG